MDVHGRETTRRTYVERTGAGVQPTQLQEALEVPVLRQRADDDGDAVVLQAKAQNHQNVGVVQAMHQGGLVQKPGDIVSSTSFAQT